MLRSSLLVGLVLFAAACGGVAEEAAERIAEAGGGDAEVDFTDDGVELSFDNGDQSLVAGANVAIPDGLSFPYPDGGNPTTALVDDSYFAVAIQYPIERYDEVATFFADWIERHDGEWQHSESTTDFDGTPIRNNTWVAGASAIIVNDCSNLDGEIALVCVTLNESR